MYLKCFWISFLVKICFFLDLESAVECDRVLQGGTRVFDGRLIILRKWTEKTGLERDLLSVFPLWIRFPHLPIKLLALKNY